jgi:hypothetical protein
MATQRRKDRSEVSRSARHGEALSPV